MVDKGPALAAQMRRRLADQRAVEIQASRVMLFREDANVGEVTDRSPMPLCNKGISFFGSSTNFCHLPL